MSSANASSSLLDLKAELSKKQDALKSTKLSEKSDVTVRTSKLRGESKKEAKVAAKSFPPPAIEDESDHERLVKSRAILEAKAKLYEKIVSQEVSVENYEEDVCLVDFRKKVKLNKELNICKSDFKDLSKLCEEKTIDSICTVSSDSTGNVIQERKETPDGPVHYQNVQFNEIRDHGVGYFAFSENEEERQNQMKMLRDLRQQSVKKQAVHNRMQERKKLALEARLSKICERRNIDKSAIVGHSAERDEELITETATVDLESIPLPVDNPVEPVTSNKKVRPWDVGKDLLFVPPENKRAKEWVEDKRSERNEEFAPPQFY